MIYEFKMIRLIKASNSSLFRPPSTPAVEKDDWFSDDDDDDMDEVRRPDPRFLNTARPFAGHTTTAPAGGGTGERIAEINFERKKNRIF